MLRACAYIIHTLCLPESAIAALSSVNVPKKATIHSGMVAFSVDRDLRRGLAPLANHLHHHAQGDQAQADEVGQRAGAR